MANQSFCLKWDGHQSNMTSFFDDLRLEDELVDITLSADGQSVKAHRMVLSACSPYFRDVLKNNPCQHMVFYMKDTSASNMRALVEFMYKGSVSVAQSQLASFIKTAESLQIRGLSGEDDKAPPPPPPPPPTPLVQRRPSASTVQVAPTVHRRSAPASQEHRLPPPSLRVSSPPAKRRRHVSSEFMAAVPISASAPSVISTPSDTELNNVTSAPSAVDSSDATASSLETSAPEPPSPTSGASNQSAMSLHLQRGGSSSHSFQQTPAESFHHSSYIENPAAELCDEPLLQAENVKVEKVDLTDVEEGEDGSLEATLGQVADYEGYDDSGQALYNESGDVWSSGAFSGDTTAGSSQQMSLADGNNSVAVRHQCPVCGKLYNLRSSMLEHIPLHQGLTKCQICSRVFSTVSHLRKHLIDFHSLDRDFVRTWVGRKNRVV